VGFIPVQFSLADSSTLKTDFCDAFQFSPATRSVLLPEPHNIPDFSNDCYLFTIFYFAYYLKIHLNLHHFDFKVRKAVPG